MGRTALLTALVSVVLCGVAPLARGTVVINLVPAVNTPDSEPRWMDIAENTYAAAYRGRFTYANATATLRYEERGSTSRAHFTADGMKPNFAYQLKFTAAHDSPGMERLGYMGRWWWEGGPLNVPDWLYEANRPNPNISSFLIFDYVVSDGTGHIEKDIAIDSTYHVLWRYGLSGVPGVAMPGPSDGFSIDTLVDPAPTPDGAYDFDYAPDRVSVYGEQEQSGGNVRPLPGHLVMAPGDYQVQFLVTEESFHSGGGLGGWWSHALISPANQMVTFTVAAEIPEPGTAALLLFGLALPAIRRARGRGVRRSHNAPR